MKASIVVLILAIVFLCASCSAFESFQREETIRTYIKNGYVLRPGNHWYNDASWVKE